MVTLIAACGLILACKGVTRNGAKAVHSPAQIPTPTPVEGPSWLKHLGLVMPDTHMGQMGGSGLAPNTARREPAIWQQPESQALKAVFHLSGADLYRINCRSCHGPDGKGAPPEIHSLMGPVQGTSAAFIERRMEARGAPISKEIAAQMAEEADKALRDRLEKGGEKMPPFSYLRPEEVAALLSYLDQLAGVPAKRPVGTVDESAAHIGEEVAKGTCHTCHDATGPGGGGMMMMMRGITPSLASFPYDYSLGQVVRQVHFGTRMMMMGGNRMPPLPYFTEPEIAAAYLYLQAYPPRSSWVTTKPDMDSIPRDG